MGTLLGHPFWRVEGGVALGVTALGIALLVVPSRTPLLGGVPVWLGFVVLFLGLLLLGTALARWCINIGRHLRQARTRLEASPVPAPWPLRRPSMFTAASLTMGYGPTVAGSRTYRITFDTNLTAGQRVSLPFVTTGLRLISPVPESDVVLTAPGFWRFRGGDVVVHDITNNGFSVEVRPNDIVVDVEIHAYGAPAAGPTTP